MAGYPRGVGRIIMDIRSGRVSLDFFFSFPFNRNRTTDSGAVRVARGARAPLIRHWPRLVLSVSSWLILNCDVLTGSREIYRPRAFSCARLDHEADTLNLKETTATRTRVSAPDVSLSPLFVSLLAVVSFVSLLPSLSLYPTRCSKKGRKRRRWKMYTVMRPREIYRWSLTRGNSSCDYKYLLFRESGPGIIESLLMRRKTRRVTCAMNL